MHGAARIWRTWTNIPSAPSAPVGAQEAGRVDGGIWEADVAGVTTAQAEAVLATGLARTRSLAAGGFRHAAAFH